MKHMKVLGTLDKLKGMTNHSYARSNMNLVVFASQVNFQKSTRSSEKVSISSGVRLGIVQGLGISLAMMAIQNLLSRLSILKDLGSSKWNPLVVRACGGDLGVLDLFFFFYGFASRKIIFLSLYGKTCF
ncbi:unnamed protein product [Musa textilis]